MATQAKKIVTKGKSALNKATKGKNVKKAVKVATQVAEVGAAYKVAKSATRFAAPLAIAGIGYYLYKKFMSGSSETIINDTPKV